MAVPCVHVCVGSLWCIVCVRVYRCRVRQLKWMTFVAATASYHSVPLLTRYVHAPFLSDVFLPVKGSEQVIYAIGQLVLNITTDVSCWKRHDLQFEI